MKPLILASSSPRRRDILESLGIQYRIEKAKYDEPRIAGLSPAELATLHARRKIETLIDANPRLKEQWVLAADTLISKNGTIYEKPETRTEARKMMNAFSGDTHEVITAIALRSPGDKPIETRLSVNAVTFAKLQVEQIDAYLDLKEWDGVAGGYRIQGKAAFFITKITGSWSGIVGLPIHLLYDILRASGYALPL